MWYDGPLMALDPDEVNDKTREWLKTLHEQLDAFDTNGNDDGHEAYVLPDFHCAR